MSVFKKVEEKEYKEFINNYPNKLDWDVIQFCEPPMGNYNDFTSGKVWPDSIVAKVKLYDGSEYHSFKSKEYYIRDSVL